ncbi:hypothetical protein M1M24_gp34 [Polaribacter phage Freya_1]|uniref:Uncharacterized protein n=1 Tax=Polaribacter phage Freya_1 TaxID=2745662 RepID=A0A8E4ZM95_9CAUD|nr:hypothetical protein M1M24_gp34 [Polaribacter phage Freya_1]QQV90971.1 hypothetical protein Freya2_34 [Polaribacter phage Freya_2]QQV91039.1 hypothetical protein Freya3_34 [Polaribacter phage Freya_3]QQV91107.1 hypothetical protein Freya4_34 [Polaribacter phage Freya_4]QQV91182.1 hypothetical protein Freya8_41 [Polaribacter phage Freya_8]QQV91259.1 hypothetical protein Freya9_43 [Polaribacter phage Freya_9]QQV91337.1 hypothetical protein Freya10_44 [Polaribacter phage Freya_10]QYV99916.1 
MLLLALAMTGIKKADEAKAETEKLQEKIDYRYTSYDNMFMVENMVVVDSAGVILGNLMLNINDSIIDAFYRSNKDWRKTRVYDNLKKGRLRILKKTE